MCFTPHNHTLTRHEHTLTRHEHTLGIFAPTSGPIAITGIEALLQNYKFCLPMVYGSYVLEKASPFESPLRFCEGDSKESLNALSGIVHPSYRIKGPSLVVH